EANRRPPTRGRGGGAVRGGHEPATVMALWPPGPNRTGPWPTACRLTCLLCLLDASVLVPVWFGVVLADGLDGCLALVPGSPGAPWAWACGFRRPGGTADDLAGVAGSG